MFCIVQCFQLLSGDIVDAVHNLNGLAGIMGKFSNNLVDFLCRRIGLCGKISNLTGNYSKSSAGIPRPRCFDGGVEREEICLGGNLGDQLCCLTNLFYRTVCCLCLRIHFADIRFCLRADGHQVVKRLHGFGRVILHCICIQFK